MGLKESHKITFFVLVGSQYCTKVLAACDHHKIPYTLKRIDPMRLTKDLPPPHTVPVMYFDGQIIPDSTQILRFLDQHLDSPDKFFPDGNQDVVDLDEYLGNRFNQFVLYFNWIDDDGFNRSINSSVKPILPFFIRPFSSWILCSHRSNITNRVRAKLPAEEIVDSRTAYETLKKELAKLNDRFTDGRKFLCGTPAPSAADFQLYGMMQHLVSSTGDANLPPCTPTLFRDANVPKLQEWHEYMEKAFPIQYKGKPAPEGVSAL
eukprot:TRINITY_DN12234_c0_g1::TRINITY_DN12234_c0_g1_i1::g.12958::m.12958 TRINITY_DN12234_c0_g1::TRINITY_DN12234_c0_g1_i1::g.12958  ORF type:complete len:280 (+),score=58.25,GST_N_3/PF13417.1/3.4e-12,GST_C_2/PF13410.1/2.1e+03,GST_C_2/PF13410.1/1.1e-07,GST_C_3/PF14497.1/5.2e+03,GST_C_3/PF14497.1/4.2e-07,GST_N_2/PF13409.1/1.1e-06,GST_N_2/PF13409.1/9.6e+02 TRINITY_DN12234_c0_g1_i1:54-842(+)